MPSVLLGVALEKIYGASFEAILAREIEKLCTNFDTYYSD
jgi:hypothetical protein